METFFFSSLRIGRVWNSDIFPPAAVAITEMHRPFVRPSIWLEMLFKKWNVGIYFRKFRKIETDTRGTKTRQSFWLRDLIITYSKLLALNILTRAQPKATIIIECKWETMEYNIYFALSDIIALRAHRCKFECDSPRIR